MFVPNHATAIPGYTGHRPEKVEDDKNYQQHRAPRHNIPGYGGYIPGVKSENVYGQTYGKTTFASSAKQIIRGMDLPPHVKFQTSMKQEFIDHAEVAHLHQTTAQIVGVERGQDLYKKVSFVLYFI